VEKMVGDTAMTFRGVFPVTNGTKVESMYVYIVPRSGKLVYRGITPKDMKRTLYPSQELELTNDGYSVVNENKGGE
jgi:hypothetical protein